MALYGYARVSTTDQDLSTQEDELRKAGCDIIRSEKMSGTTRQGRSELDTLLEFIRGGDSLVVTRVDRLARSVKDLQDIAEILEQKGAHLVTTKQNVDTRDSMGRLFFDLLGVFASFETNLRRERQLEGITKAKAKGKYKGRKPTARAKTEEALRLHAEGVPVTQLCEQLGIGRSSFYRMLKQAER